MSGVRRQSCQSAYRRGSRLGLFAGDDVDRVSVCDARLFQIQLRLEETTLEQDGLHERTNEHATDGSRATHQRRRTGKGDERGSLTPANMGGSTRQQNVVLQIPEGQRRKPQKQKIHHGTAAVVCMVFLGPDGRNKNQISVRFRIFKIVLQNPCFCLHSRVRRKTSNLPLQGTLHTTSLPPSNNGGEKCTCTSISF